MNKGSHEVLESSVTNRIPAASIVGLVIAAVVAGWGTALGFGSPPGWPDVARMAGMVAALVLAGVGVAACPKSPMVLMVAAATSFLTIFSVNPEWDSYRLLGGVAAAVALVAAIVVVLPSGWQKAFVSFLVVFHFLGILSAITSPPPQSWLSTWAWVTLFRPHLIFCYTNNAYQFYSPEPGPANLLWCCIESHDGKKSWYKMPRRPETNLDPMAVQYYRRLSITESANQNFPLPITPPMVEQRRRSYSHIIPLHPYQPVPVQFRLPQDFTRKSIASYARHIAQMHGGKDAIKSVRVYRVLHEMLRPNQFAEGEDPFQPWQYHPYYLGEFDAEGNMSDPDDPMLYWLVPIVRRNTLTGAHAGPAIRGRPIEIDNYLAQHAGSDPFQAP